MSKKHKSVARYGNKRPGKMGEVYRPEVPELPDEDADGVGGLPSLDVAEANFASSDEDDLETPADLDDTEDGEDFEYDDGDDDDVPELNLPLGMREDPDDDGDGDNDGDDDEDSEIDDILDSDPQEEELRRRRAAARANEPDDSRLTWTYSCVPEQWEKDKSIKPLVIWGYRSNSKLAEEIYNRSGGEYPGMWEITPMVGKKRKLREPFHIEVVTPTMQAIRDRRDAMPPEERLRHDIHRDVAEDAGDLGEWSTWGEEDDAMTTETMQPRSNLPKSQIWTPTPEMLEAARSGDAKATLEIARLLTEQNERMMREWRESQERRGGGLFGDMNFERLIAVATPLFTGLGAWLNRSQTSQAETIKMGIELAKMANQPKVMDYIGMILMPFAAAMGMKMNQDGTLAGMGMPGLPNQSPPQGSTQTQLPAATQHQASGRSDTTPTSAGEPEENSIWAVFRRMARLFISGDDRYTNHLYWVPIILTDVRKDHVQSILSSNIDDIFDGFNGSTQDIAIPPTMREKVRDWLAQLQILLRQSAEVFNVPIQSKPISPDQRSVEGASDADASGAVNPANNAGVPGNDGSAAPHATTPAG